MKLKKPYKRHVVPKYTNAFVLRYNLFMKGLINYKIGKIAILVLVAVLTGTALKAEITDFEQSTPAILADLCDSLEFTNPVFLDIRCGEWTPVLEREIRKKLLSRQVDLRELNIGLIKDNNDFLPLAMETDWGVNGEMLLQMLQLSKADLLELSMEQSVEKGEKRRLFSYARYQTPVYRFVLKQIELPGQKLVSIKEYKLDGKPEIENPGSLLAMKWYEPILASAILGSLVYMLWTLK